MEVEQFLRRVRIAAPANAVFLWHSRPGAFERLTPPWERVRLLQSTGGIRDGAQVVIEIQAGPLRRRWIAEHRNYIEGRQFQDVQVSGPFALWEHTHRFEPESDTTCILEDSIRYALPLGIIGRWLGSKMVRNKLDRMFSYRHRVTSLDVLTHFQSKRLETMKILVSGSHGLIGSALVAFLTGGGHEVTRLVRSHSAARPTREAEIVWDIEAGKLESAAIDGFDAIIHLAGENIAAGRWTRGHKTKILQSRLKGTSLLCDALAKLRQSPKVLISASAIGFYGNRDEEILHEESAKGQGFLPDVVEQWEQATETAARSGVRVVRLRFGVVLSPAGGALAKMLPSFRLGAGGKVGSGRQYMSWVALDDVIGAIHHALTHEYLRGAVNVVAPQAVTNLQFTKALGMVLGRPTVTPFPAFAARLVFGEMADALLLGSTRAEPRKLLESEYRFCFPDIEPALRHMLGKGGKAAAS